MSQLKVALSHDVDRVRKTHQYITRSLRFLRHGQLNSLGREVSSFSKRNEVYWNFPDIMKTEDTLGVRSTFFFLLESYPFRPTHPSTWKLALGRYDIRSDKIINVIKELDKEGWEIGLHGSYSSYSDAALLKHEKKQLEQVVGHPVKGIRQHYLNLNSNTWRYQEDAGFHYDSSLGFTDRIGYKSGMVAPFKPHNSSFIEFPLAIMDSCFLEDPDSDDNLKKIIDLTIANDGVLVLNWHSNSWHPDEYTDYKEKYVGLIKLFKAQGAIFKTLGEFCLELNSMSTTSTEAQNK